MLRTLVPPDRNKSPVQFYLTLIFVPGRYQMPVTMNPFDPPTEEEMRRQWGERSSPPHVIVKTPETPLPGPVSEKKDQSERPQSGPYSSQNKILGC